MLAARVTSSLPLWIILLLLLVSAACAKRQRDPPDDDDEDDDGGDSWAESVARARCASRCLGVHGAAILSAPLQVRKHRA